METLSRSCNWKKLSKVGSLQILQNLANWLKSHPNSWKTVLKSKVKMLEVLISHFFYWSTPEWLHVNTGTKFAKIKLFQSHLSERSNCLFQLQPVTLLTELLHNYFSTTFSTFHPKYAARLSFHIKDLNKPFKGDRR